jgi:hypothetical protein
MSWNTVLADKTKYPDDTKITLAEGLEVTLGDLRSLTAAEQRKLTEGLSDLARQQEELKRAQLEAADFYSKVLEESKNLKGKTVEKKAENLADSLGLDPALAPYLEPIVKKIEEVEKANGERFKTFEDTVQKLSKGIIDMTSYYLNDKWESQFNALPDRDEDMTVEKLVKYATENRILDRMGMPDLRTAHERMTEPKRKAKLEAEAEKRGLEKAKKELAVHSPSRPRTTFIPANKDNGKATPTSIAEAVDAAFNDPEIQASLAEVRR